MSEKYKASGVLFSTPFWHYRTPPQEGAVKWALEYEKGDIINASQQKRGKIIDLKKEELRHKDLKSKAENHEIIEPTENTKKEIDSN